MPDIAEQPDSAKRTRSLTGFYVAVCVVIALGLFGVWFWRTWTVWWLDADEAKRRQAEAAAKLGVPVEKALDLGGGVNLELVLIPPGRFKMGSPEYEQEWHEGEDLHWVTISRSFYMGRCEVTQDQWERVMGGNPSEYRGAKNPVEQVSWEDCQTFLMRLNDLWKGNGLFRLPTEAEWEWACRAGTKTRFCFGDDEGKLGEYAWYWRGRATKATTSPVSMKLPNAWGLFDCHGNVMEWCADWYENDYYTKSPNFDPAGPIAGTARVTRGGSWFHESRAARSSCHSGNPPATRSSDAGFRVALAPAEP